MVTFAFIHKTFGLQNNEYSRAIAVYKALNAYKAVWKTVERLYGNVAFTKQRIAQYNNQNSPELKKFSGVCVTFTKQLE